MYEGACESISPQSVAPGNFHGVQWNFGPISNTPHALAVAGMRDLHRLPGP